MTIFVKTSATFTNFLSSAHLETQKITHFHSFVTRDYNIYVSGKRLGYFKICALSK